MNAPAWPLPTAAVVLVLLALLAWRVAYLRTERWIEQEGGDDDR